MYDDIFESIRYEAEKRNLRESTIQLVLCSDVSYFLRWIGKTASELTLDDAESFLYCQTSGRQVSRNSQPLSVCN